MVCGGGRGAAARADGGVVKGIPFGGSVHASTHPFSVSRNRCNIEAIVQNNCHFHVPITLAMDQ